MTKKTKKFLNRKLEEWKGVTKREDVEEGFWQFCIDHAIKFDDNTYRVMFVMSEEKKDLLRRIYARASGAYKIEKDDNFYRAEQKLFEEFIYWKYNKEK